MSRARGLARRAFTLIELMVVLGIIAALASLIYGASSFVLARSKRENARSLVQAVYAAAILYQNQNEPTMMCQVAGKQQLRRLWDIDDDGLLDEDPARPAAASALVALAPAGYHGFAYHSGIQLRKGQVDGRGAVVDPWGGRLRIIFRIGGFGTQGFGIASDGPDGVSSPDDGNADDIVSWR